MRKRLKSGKLLAVGIVVCSLVLAYLSLGALRYEKLILEREMAQRSAAIAAGLEAQVRATFERVAHEVQSALGELRARGAGAAELRGVAPDLPVSCAGLVDARLDLVYPANPWKEQAAAEPLGPMRPFQFEYERAEQIEFRDGPGPAVAGYTRLAAMAAGPREKAVRLSALARAHVKLGETSRAVALYEQIRADFAEQRSYGGVPFGPAASLAVANLFMQRQELRKARDACVGLLQDLLLPGWGLSRTEAFFFQSEAAGLVRRIKGLGIVENIDCSLCDRLIGQLEYVAGCVRLVGVLRRSKARRIVAQLVGSRLIRSPDPAEYKRLLDQVEELFAARGVLAPGADGGTESGQGADGPRYVVMDEGELLGWVPPGRAGQDGVVFSVSLAGLGDWLRRAAEDGLRYAGDFAFEIVDAGGRRIAARRADSLAGSGENRSLAHLLPGWRLRVALGGAPHLRRAIRRRLYLNTGIVLLLLVGIGGSMVSMVRMVRRQQELAGFKMDLISTVSHELRTPITAVRMIAEMFEMDAVRDAARAKEYYRRLGEESERLLLLINNLLDFSRLDSGRKKYDFAAHDIGALVRDAVRAFSRYAGPRGYKVTEEIGRDLPAVRVDAGALGQIVLNLLDNAMKYSPADRPIRVRVFRAGPEVCIDVIDRGCGIPLEEQDRIFERFYRGSGEQVRGAKGSGVGLAIVREFVQEHGGSVRVQSRQGEGSTFRVVLPIAEDDGDGTDSDRRG